MRKSARIKYRAVLFSPDGDWVTDFEGETKEDVQEMLADRGSRWYFYPFEAIIRDGVTVPTISSRNRLVDALEPLDAFIGKSIKSASRFLRDNPDLVYIYLV